jgi:hypothetical protein
MIRKRDVLGRIAKIDEVESFWEKVNKWGPLSLVNGTLSRCWTWTAAIDEHGYGIFRNNRAHRVAYRLVRGCAIPKELVTDHLCKNPTCINPDHLEGVTVQVNTLRGNGPTSQNAQKMTCKKGHPLTGDNLAPYRLKQGKRICLICHKEWSRVNSLERYHAKRESIREKARSRYANDKEYRRHILEGKARYREKRRSKCIA